MESPHVLDPSWSVGAGPPLTALSHTHVMPSLHATLDHPSMLNHYVFPPPPVAEYMGSEYAFRNVPLWVTIFGYLGVISTSLVSLAPWPTVREIRVKKSVGSMPLLPFSVMSVNAFAWLLYGFLLSDPVVWLPSVLSFPLSIYFFLEYASFCPSPRKLSFHAVGSLIAMILTSILAVVPPPWIAVQVVGLECAAICVLRDMSPLASLKDVISTKSAKSLPLPLTASCLVNVVLWLIYSRYAINDVLIYICYMFRLSVTLLQLALIFRYGSGPSDTSKDQIPNKREQHGECEP